MQENFGYPRANIYLINWPPLMNVISTVIYVQPQNWNMLA